MMNIEESSGDPLLNKEYHSQQIMKRNIREKITNRSRTLLKQSMSERSTSLHGCLSNNYMYMILWPIWRAYFYVFLARLFYNGTLYIFLLLQFLISVHFCGFNGILAFCNFIAFKELISNIPSDIITRVFSFSAHTHQLTNDFTFVRGLLILYVLVYVCYLILILLIIVPLRRVLVDAINTFPAVIKRFPQYDPQLLADYLVVISLPLQGLGLGICNLISMEHRYFLPGIIVFSVVLFIIFFQLLFLFSKDSIAVHIQGLPTNVVLMLAGVPQLVFGVCSIAMILYISLVGRTPYLRKYNLSLQFRYIYRIDIHMIANLAVKIIILLFQHSVQPLLILFVQRRISQSSTPFEHYCMQILCVVVYYLLVQCTNTIVLSSSEAYAAVKAVYKQAGISTNLWLLKLLFPGTALILSSILLLLLQTYREKAMVMSIPLAFRTHSDLFPLYFSNYDTRYTIAIGTCFIHLITSLFATYFNVNVMFDEPVMYSLLVIVYMNALLIVTICVTLEHTTSDSALSFIFLIINVFTIPIYVLRSLFTCNRKAHKSNKNIKKENSVCTNIFQDALKEY